MLHAAVFPLRIPGIRVLVRDAGGFSVRPPRNPEAHF